MKHQNNLAALEYTRNSGVEKGIDFATTAILKSLEREGYDIEKLDTAQKLTEFMSADAVSVLRAVMNALDTARQVAHEGTFEAFEKHYPEYAEHESYRLRVEVDTLALEVSFD